MRLICEDIVRIRVRPNDPKDTDDQYKFSSIEDARAGIKAYAIPQSDIIYVSGCDIEDLYKEEKYVWMVYSKTGNTPLYLNHPESSLIYTKHRFDANELTVQEMRRSLEIFNSKFGKAKGPYRITNP